MSHCSHHQDILSHLRPKAMDPSDLELKIQEKLPSFQAVCLRTVERLSTPDTASNCLPRNKIRWSGPTQGKGPQTPLCSFALFPPRVPDRHIATAEKATFAEMRSGPNSYTFPRKPGKMVLPQKTRGLPAGWQAPCYTEVRARM